MIPHSLGRRSGANLLHSFSRFDVQVGESATFTGPATIDAVIARITGGSESRIDGALRSQLPNADLYLVNPSGIVIGETATLDVRGAFHVSTAQHMEFEDGTRLALGSASPSTLSAAPPRAFGFGGAQRASVRIIGANLAVDEQRAFTVSAADVSVEQAALEARGGRIAIAAVGNSGRVAIDGATTMGADGGALTLTGPRPLTDGARPGIANLLTRRVDDVAPGRGPVSLHGGDIVLDDFSIVTGGGDIDVRASRTLATRATSSLSAERAGSATGERARAGRITLSAPDITVTDRTRLQVAAQPGVDAGRIDIEGDTIRIGSARIDASARLDGNAGRIEVTGSDVRVDGQSVLVARAALFGATGNGGIIHFDTDSLTLAGQASVDAASINSAGSGGTLRIDTGEFFMAGASLLLAATTGALPGGLIEIDADVVALGDRAKIGTTTFGTGIGGVIDIDAGRLSMAGDSVITSGTESAGAGGRIDLVLGTLDMRERAVVSAESEGDNVLLDEFPIAPATRGGSGGDISLDAERVELRDQASILAATSGTGRGGDLDLDGGSWRLRDASSVAATSAASGVAGAIDLNARESLSIDGASVATSARFSDGGNITLTAADLALLRDGDVTTSVSTDFGNGGDIALEARFVVLDDGRVVARAARGGGGDIQIASDALLISARSVVSASSQFGVDGAVLLQSPARNEALRLEALPTDLLDAAALVTTPCALRVRGDASALLLARAQGHARSPDDLQPSFAAPAGATSVQAHIQPNDLDCR